jgi:hypothetical protein
LQNSPRFYSENPPRLFFKPENCAEQQNCKRPDNTAYFAGTAGGTLLSVWGVVELPGICAAGLVSMGAATGAVTLAPSSTLPDEAGVRLPKYAKDKVQTKNTVANTAVVRDMKLALPVAPNKLLEPLPLPKAAPMSAPLPCWIKIKPIMVKADNICTTKIKVNITSI